jgi:hypothetical protein
MTVIGDERVRSDTVKLSWASAEAHRRLVSMSRETARWINRRREFMG